MHQRFRMSCAGSWWYLLRLLFKPFVDFLGNKERAGSTKKEVVKSRVRECEVGLQVSTFVGWVSRLTTYQRFVAITAEEAQTTTQQQQRSRKKTALRFTHQKRKQRDSHSYRHITIVPHDAPPPPTHTHTPLTPLHSAEHCGNFAGGLHMEV